MILFLAGCDTPDRVTHLEKQVQELQTKVSENQTVIDYNLQAKCAKDANTWFDEGWGRGGKGTILLDHTNHYNKALNKCFTLVEYHHETDPAPSWTNMVSLWDVYENSKYADFTENHFTYFRPTLTTSNEVFTCECNNKKCKSFDEFNGLVRPYMSN
jgi:hypothetical protein